MTDYVPDPYAAALDKMRTPAEKAYLVERAAQFAAIKARAASVLAEVASSLRTLAARDDDPVENYKAPCGYCAHIDELRRDQ